MKRKKKKTSKNSEEPEIKEYGVVLTKEEKYRHRIYPQKGKVPEEDDEYKVV
ncbi:hypothetical protein LCGC14_2850130 [marine sediment metagenome]|uniref:Uncharacterized protein n=1 Tax=marine sediment metagenome TaxID=412755 RepID=A0A0F9AZJ5_9ZZZZ